MGRGGQEPDDGKRANDSMTTELDEEQVDGGTDTFDNPVAREHADAPKQDVPPPVPAGGQAVFDATDSHTGVGHRPASRICGVRVSTPVLAAFALVQLTAASMLFVVGVRMMSPDEEEDKFWAVMREPSVALGVEPGAAARGLVISAVAAALVVVAGALLRDTRDRLLAPWLNSFWAPRGLAAARPLGIVVAPRGRVLAVVALVCAVAYIAYVPNTMLFDGDPKLSKQLGTAAGDCMALALIPIPKRSILIPMAGIPFERAIYYHRLLGRMAVALGTVHGIASMYDWTVRPENVGVPALDVVADRLNPFCTVRPTSGGGHRRVQTAEAVVYDNNRDTLTVGDPITPSVTLRRSRTGCIFNGVTHRGASNRGPGGTTWALGNLADVGVDTGDPSIYGTFCQMTDRQRNQIGTIPSISHWVMHALEEDLYFDIVFTRWSDSSDGGFTYTRTAVAPPGPCDAAETPCLNGAVCTNGGDCSDRSPWTSGLQMEDRDLTCADYETNGYCSVVGFGDTDWGGSGSAQDACCGCGGGETSDYTCTCPAGWQGVNCDINVDECVSAPCANGGVCSDGDDEYACTCATGFTSTLSSPDCAENIDECASRPCQHGACTDAVDSYTCACEVGWEGDNCGADIDDCAPAPCEHGGQCTDRPNSYICDCASGWSGETCAENIDECASRPCQHGSCTDAVDSYTCACEVGWEGDNCGADIDDCAPAPCEHGGQCTDRPNSYICDCASGWSGETCAENIDECASRPCQHGSCTDAVDSYTCACEVGWEGDNCGADIDDCAPAPCEHGGQCTDRLNSYICDCASGWSGENCTDDVDECASRPCAGDGSTCDDGRDGSDMFVCTCRPGLTGDRCEIDVDECAPGPCSVNSDRCIDGDNDYVCVCSSGWQGHNCDEEVNLCRSEAVNCDPLHANCIHVGPGQDTCECVTGYESATFIDGVGTGEVCTEINECAAEPCLHGECTDQFLGFVCDCASGYRGERCDLDINDCASSPCRHGRCTDAGPDLYTCACDNGWSGEECQINIDDCAPAPCLNNAVCSDEVLAYRCSCSQGFAGENCAENIDECASRPCQHGSCTDAVDSYTCACEVGWEGDNCGADIDDCAPAPCEHGGQCTDRPNSYICDCASGWSGETCAENIDECASRPCLHGRCRDGLDDYRCSCAAGWEGDNCDVDTDDCLSEPCANRGSCSDSIDEYSCRCTRGWSGDNCEENVDECASAPCLNGRCSDLVASYNCDCLMGWNGENCGVNIDECASQPCGNSTFGTCLDHVANYTCSCAEGWAGYNCDETLSIHVELQIEVEQFDETSFVKDVAELLHLSMGERIVVDSVLPGSVIVTFHIEGQGTTSAAAASHLLQETVQTAVSTGADIRFGGAAVLSVEGLRPSQPVDTSGCDRDALLFDGPDDHFKNVTGIVAGTAFLLILATSMGFVRRGHFQLFYRSHVLLGLVALVGLAYHYDLGKLDVAAPFLFLMLVDYIVRAWLALSSGGSIVSVAAVGPDCVALEVSAPEFSRRHTEAGQYVFIRLPQISQLQWHPMTITSSPGDKNLVFLIKAAGDWSEKLLVDGEPALHVGDQLSLDGPYGRLSVRLSQQRELLLVAGGIGCTPMLSILGNLPPADSLRARFVWTVRDLPLVEHCMPTLMRAVSAGHSVVVHYTGKDGVEEALRSVRSASSEDPSTGTGTIEAIAGRPVFVEQLHALDKREGGDADGSVGVLSCGPQRMVDAVKLACIEASTRGSTRYDFHSEVFEW